MNGLRNYDAWKTHNPAEDITDPEEIFPVENWQKAVAKGKTLLGYDDWVQERVEESEQGPDPDDARDQALDMEWGRERERREDAADERMEQI